MANLRFLHLDLGYGCGNAAVTGVAQGLAGGGFNQCIGGWSTPQVSHMAHIFVSTSSLNQGIGHWNTSQVRDMIGMFYYASRFTQGIGGWGTSQVRSMSYMLFGAQVSIKASVAGTLRSSAA